MKKERYTDHLETQINRSIHFVSAQNWRQAWQNPIANSEDKAECSWRGRRLNGMGHLVYVSTCQYGVPGVKIPQQLHYIRKEVIISSVSQAWKPWKPLEKTLGNQRNLYA